MVEDILLETPELRIFCSAEGGTNLLSAITLELRIPQTEPFQNFINS